MDLILILILQPVFFIVFFNSLLACRKYLWRGIFAACDRIQDGNEYDDEEEAEEEV